MLCFTELRFLSDTPEYVVWTKLATYIQNALCILEWRERREPLHDLLSQKLYVRLYPLVMNYLYRWLLLECFWSIDFINSLSRGQSTNQWFCGRMSGAIHLVAAQRARIESHSLIAMLTIWIISKIKYFVSLMSHLAYTANHFQSGLNWIKVNEKASYRWIASDQSIVKKEIFVLLD